MGESESVTTRIFAQQVLFWFHAAFAAIMTLCSLMPLFWVLMAESGGKDSHPGVAALIVWAISDQWITARYLWKDRMKTGHAVRYWWLTIGAVMLYFASTACIFERLCRPGATENLLVLPYTCALVGSWLLRRGARSGAAG